MKVNEYAQHDAIALGELVRSGQVSIAELNACAEAAIERANEALNFLAGPTPDEASRNIEQMSAGGVFMGVPTLVKDIGPRVKGMLQEAGSELCKGQVAQADSEIVRRWRKSGLVIHGRTNTPEFGTAFTTESRATGPTRNPWNPDHSSGGSSGGAAAAVAAGAVPMAMGGDSGGSIRVPAHCCGLFGFKPSRGRNPVGPELGESNSGFTVVHALTRTVRDSAAMLDTTAGADPGCRYFCPPPRTSFLQAASTPPAPLRMAYSTISAFGGAVDQELVTATRQAAALCAELGHQVEEVSPPIDGDELVDIVDCVWSANLYYAIQGIAQRTGRVPDANTLEASSLAIYERGATVSCTDFLDGMSALNTFCRRIGQFFERYDVLITPTFACTAPKLGEIQTDSPVSDLKAYFNGVFSKAPFTMQYNLTGQPAMSVPLFASSAGLPIGVQFCARLSEEETLFALAGQLEKALPWADRRASDQLTGLG